MARPETLSEPGGAAADGPAPELSIVVTLFEERETLDELHGRLTGALEEQTCANRRRVERIEAHLVPPGQPQRFPVRKFGRTQTGLFDEDPSERGLAPFVEPAYDPPPSRRRTAILAALAGACIVAGASAGLMASRSGNDAKPAPPVAAPVTDTVPQAAEPVEPAPLVVPAAEQGAHAAAGSATEAGSDAPAEDVATDVEEPTAETPPKKRQRFPIKRRPKITQGAGSASTTASKTTPKVQWDPTMLMPTDKQKKKR